MKICFLAAANSVHSKKWIEYFVNKGHEIHWISLTQDSFSASKNTEFHLIKNFKLKPLNILFNALFIRKLVKRINPDVLHAHYAGVYGVLGALSGFHPLIITAWGSDVLITAKSKIRKPLIKFALDKADLITCNGEPLKKAMKKMGVSSHKIKFIYWATDIEKFRHSPKDMELKKELKLFDCPVIISVRSLEPAYDIETLIKALPSVLKEFPMVKLIIGGQGSREKNLKKLAQELGISESIRFVGMIPHDDMPKFFNSSDIYVSTSLSDGDLSQSTQQAMACELPVITTDIEVNKKRIKNGENGFIVPVKNPQSLSEKIILLLKDEKLRTELGKTGRRTIEDELNYYKEMEKAEDLCRELINSQKK